MKTPRIDIDGILLLDKPIGFSSNQALQKVKYLCNAKKAGHTGSLDPLATGMLPLCFGQATKYSQYLLDSNKTYEVTGCLGIQTTTGDSEGEVIAQQEVLASEEDLRARLPDFEGEMDQVPPMYSALKKDGQPLYKLARKGVTVERKARRITIFSLECLSVSLPYFSLRVTCSKGTYIRSLIEDIGSALKVGAHVTSLRRLNVSPFEDQAMVSLDALAELSSEEIQSMLLPMDAGLAALSTYTLDDSDCQRLMTGLPLQLDAMLPQQYRLYHKDRGFLGVAMVDATGQVVKRRLVAFERR